MKINEFITSATAIWTLGAGVFVALVTAIAGYYSIEGRISRLEDKTTALTAPRDPRVAICSRTVERLSAAMTESIRNPSAIQELSNLTDRLGCYDLATAMSHNSSEGNTTESQ